MSGLVPVAELSKRMQKSAWVEVVCVDSPSHWCVGYRLLKATTPPKKQVCDYCGGPVAPSGQGSVWPSLLVVDQFVEPGDQRPTHEREDAPYTHIYAWKNNGWRAAHQGQRCRVIVDEDPFRSFGKRTCLVQFESGERATVDKYALRLADGTGQFYVQETLA